MNQVIDCKSIAKNILDMVKAVPNKKALLTISVGKDKGFESYLKGIKKDCKYCGIEMKNIQLEEKDEVGFFNAISMGNKDDRIGGIIVPNNLPCLYHYDAIYNILDEKDIDNAKGVCWKLSCIVEAVEEILKTQYDDLTGKNALVVGRGRVGREVAEMLLSKDCTVTIAHSKTENLKDYLYYPNIIVSAVGKPVICGYDCWGSTIIDCGISVGENGKLQGDLYGINRTDQCDYTTAQAGVNLVTRAVLLRRLSKI